MGRWLVANVLGWAEARDQLVAQMPKGALRADDFAVLEESGTLALRRHFGTDYEVREVTDFAIGVRDSWELPYGGGLLDLEAVMRGALGERDVDMSGIPADVQGEAHFFSMMQVSRLRGWNEYEVNSVVAEAEAITFGRGWKPHIASTG